MTEIEQLRKEINELRERIAQLEARPVGPVVFGPGHTAIPRPMLPPFVITC